GDPGGRSTRLALGPRIRIPRHAPGADAADRAAGLAGAAVPADDLGTDAANPSGAGYLRRILHPVLAVAPDLLRGAVVGVRARLHRVRRTGGRLLVAVAAGQAQRKERSRAVRPMRNMRVFSRFPIGGDRKSTRLNSSHVKISYAVFCLKKKK